MSTSSPTDTPQPAEPNGPAGAEPPAVESAPTISIGKVPEAAAAVAPAPVPAPSQAPVAAAAPAWQPRPHEQLSPEDKDPQDLTDEELEALTSGPTSSGVLGGAAAIISGALGLASITGTWLGALISERQKLIGGINSNGKSPAVQISEGYTTPWHRMAEFNGIFALVALLVGIGVLFAGKFLAVRPLPNWVRAVAWAGLGLGVIGLLVSGAMYFDWFTGAIKVPAATTSSTGG